MEMVTLFFLVILPKCHTGHRRRVLLRGIRRVLGRLVVCFLLERP